MFGAGQAQWHAVSRALRKHWYHVVVQGIQAGRVSELILMVDNEHKLQEMLIAQDDELGIAEAQVVTPPWMNRTSEWRMEPLKEVSVGQDKYGCEVSLIEVESGASYHTSHSPGFNSNLLTNLRPIFLPSMIRGG